MTYCELLLTAGLLQAGACDAGQTPVELQAIPVEPAVQGELSEDTGWTKEASSELVTLPSGRRTGFTLYDVARNVTWRNAAFDSMVTND